MKVKMYLTIKVDTREYQMPTDGNVGKELEQAIEEYLFDIEGLKVQTIKTTTE